MLPFIARAHVEYTFKYYEPSKSYIKKSNINPITAQLLMLSKKGYGTYIELNSLPCEIILDMLEYEQILQTIEAYEVRQAQNGNAN